MLVKKKRSEKRVIVAIDAGVKNEAKDYADKNNYTLASVIETAIKQFLERRRQ